MANVFVAAYDAIVSDCEGGFVAIRKNVTRIVEGHPILENNPEAFKPADEGAHFATRTAKTEPTVAKAPAQPVAETPADPVAPAEDPKASK